MSESSDERSPGFKRSLISKLVVVGIFVAIGTVSVAYFVKYCQDCNKAELAKLENGETSPGPTDEENPAQKNPTLTLKPVSSQTTPKLQSTNKNTNFSSSFNPSKSNPSKTGSKQNSLPESKSFSMPKVVKPQSNFSPTSTINSTSNSFGSGNGTLNQAAQKAKENINNRFQQIKQSTNQFANSASQKAKTATNQIAEKTGNALRNVNNSLAPSRSDNPNSNRQNFNSRSNPSTGFQTSNNNSLPPIKPRASFDASKDLKPFNSKSGSNSSNSAAPRNFGQQPRPPLSNSNTQLPRTPPRNNPTAVVSTSPIRTPSNRNVSTIARSSTNSTRNTPGDRKLEGIQSPTVTIEKIAPREIQVNKAADFQLIVKNVGRIAANNVVVFDQIPTGTVLVQSVPQPQKGPGSQISWELDTLNPGQEKRIKLQLKPTAPGEIGSVAQVTFSAMASMRTKVTKPVLAVSHSTDPRVLIGDSVVLNIDVKNAGDGPATDVIIQEDLPEGLSFSEGFRELEYAVGTLGPGQSRKIRLELKAAKIGKYRNILVAHADGGLQAQHAVDVEVIAPSLQATGEGPTRRFLKREATHRFAVRNSGTANATNVELVCQLPGGLRYISANNRGKYDENTHAVYWSLAELGTGLVANVELTTVPTEPGNQDLKFEAKSDLNQSANAICKLSVEHLVDVFFDIDDVVDPIEIGSDTSYRLRIVNQGTKTATNVQLQVEFPRGIQPTGVDGNIGNEIRGQQIAFQPITSMNPGDEIELTIRGKGITAGDHRVVVNLIADGREVNVSKQESTRVYSDR